MIPHLTHELFDIKGVSHGFFGREGGVSKGQYGSLNCGRGSDDAPELVAQNRALVAGVMGVSPDKLLGTAQIHSPYVQLVDENYPLNIRPEADGLVTKLKGVALSALAADCGPVLFCDPKAEVIGSCHAGWKGALAGVTDSIITLMVASGAKRENIRAVLGPCISRDNYEVGEEFRDSFLSQDPSAPECFHSPKDKKPHFDLKAYVLGRLTRAGLSHVAALPDCTYAAPDTYFSYRYNTHYEIKGYGRQISAISLRE